MGQARKRKRMLGPPGAAVKNAGPARRAGVKPAYDFASIEARWRAHWERIGIYRPDLATAPRPFYNLMMFPYPSAEGLHVGNMYAFIGSDVQGRWRAMQGYDVFEPMGFDAFGIHSENFAIKQGVHPRALTERNVARFRVQLQGIGNRFDWSREVQTTDPAFYRWTQWIFVRLFKAGLAERKPGVVNWCPNDKTVLADEQVIGGRCERCGAVVEPRELEQWYLKITRYADKLLENLDHLDWSERVKAAQRHWIGRSMGAEVDFTVEDRADITVRVFTSRPDTIYGVTFLALALNHPTVESLTTGAAERAGVEAVRARSERERVTLQERAEREPVGAFTGAYATHPLSGERIPIWVTEYVVGDYGTGAVMGVPAHDARDHAFARVYGLPVRAVVRPTTSETDQPEPVPSSPYAGEGYLVDSGDFSGLDTAEARRRIVAAVEARGAGRPAVRYHLRDWLISRQRYWGAPIPIVYCPAHGAVPVPDDQLPVMLPPLEDYRPTTTGSSPLASVPEFVNTTCPICEEPARRETDVSDNLLDSAWYFLRYPSSGESSRPWDPTLTRNWLPPDMYVGGAEHGVLHLLYTRFVTMALHDLGLLDFEEPFPHFRANGTITRDGAKMSKSKGNVVSADDYITRYGADAFRTYMLFMGPYDAGGDFSDRGLGGVVRFLNRVWAYSSQHGANAAATAPEGAALRALNRTIARVTEDVAALKYNTAIAALMAYLNSLEARPAVTRTELRTLLLLLAPFAPFITEELWSRLGGEGSIHTRQWPRVEAEASPEESVTLVVQVNGRVRDRIAVPADVETAEIERLALACPGARHVLAGRPPARIVIVPGRLVNIVASE